MSNYVTDTPVPFAPIPTHLVDMVLIPASERGAAVHHRKAPMPDMWADWYRKAAIRLCFDFDDAREAAAMGWDLEAAYMKRERAEYAVDTRGSIPS